MVHRKHCGIKFETKNFKFLFLLLMKEITDLLCLLNDDNFELHKEM